MRKKAADAATVEFLERLVAAASEDAKSRNVGTAANGSWAVLEATPQDPPARDVWQCSVAVAAYVERGVFGTLHDRRC